MKTTTAAFFMVFIWMGCQKESSKTIELTHKVDSLTQVVNDLLQQKPTDRRELNAVDTSGTYAFRRSIYNGMTKIKYTQSFETFVSRNSKPESIGKLYSMLRRNQVYSGSLNDFKARFFGTY